MIRHQRTIKFLKKHLKTGTALIDLGNQSVLSDLMEQQGYLVSNTDDTDLDVDYDFIDLCNVITAFEVFEHMFAPFNLLLKAHGTLIASVPLKVWFANAYWNTKDKRDCHYHEFEIKQFNRLLERTGWTITDSEVWRTPDKLRLGIRPILRFIFSSYYIVKAIK